MIRLLIAASGTGGHVFPALAVAKKLPNYDVHWLGTSNRLEQSLVNDLYPLHTIPVEGFQTRSILKNIKILFRLLQSVFWIRKLLKEKKIDVIFTTGGYISGAVTLAAYILGIPVILHESNYIPGKTTKLLSYFCHVTALGFKETEKYLPWATTTYLGTPIREQFSISQYLDLNIPEKAFLIIVIGGSQGAVSINNLERQCALDWINSGAYVVHLTGNNDTKVKTINHTQYITLPFHSNMAALLQRANLAISRAGSGTLAELAATHTPAILIPYPFAAENHQFYNADFFVKAKAAYCYEQKKLTREQLKIAVLDLIKDPTKLKEMAYEMSKLTTKDSAEKLAELINNSLKN